VTGVRSILFALVGSLYGIGTAMAAHQLWTSGHPIVALLAVFAAMAVVGGWAVWYGSWGHAVAVLERRQRRELARR
jgi:hypothetical protein